MQDTVSKVIVIGAGMAGIAAANELQSAGVNVVVLGALVHFELEKRLMVRCGLNVTDRSDAQQT